MSEEKKKGASWVFKSLFILALLGTLLVTLGGGAIYWHYSKDLPKIISVEDYRPLTVSRVLADNGKDDALIGEFFKERRYVIPYDKIPDQLVKAFVSAEDDKFFEHQGVNLASMIRASIANFRAGHVVQGGSTITQQVAKSLLLTRERTFARKIKELIIASRIESNLTKQQILYLYLNQIYLGHGAYGVQAASKTYFRKDVSQLSLAESAVLAGMPQAPGIYSPNLNPKKAKERQLYVLRRMYENKYISQAQMTDAAASPLRIYHDQDLNTKYAAYLVEHVRRYLVDKYGEKAVYEDGLTASVPATMDNIQAARTSLREGLRAVDKRAGFRGPLQHLKSMDEIEQVLKEERSKLIERRLGFQMFMPDGKLDPVASIKTAGMQSDVDLLSTGELYEAVVTGFDSKKKTASLMLGAIKGEIPAEQLKWAKAEKADFLSKGDVVLVKPVNLTGPSVTFALEQTPQVQGALFSLDATTGYVLAMEGGYDFEQSEFNRAIQAQRQPGSSFKPIIYAAGLEKGFTPASIIVDSPIVYEDQDSIKWKPSNFEEKFYGDTTYRQALIKSRNVPTIKIVQAIQVPFLINYAKRLGMTAQFNADLSISLGSMAISPMEMTRIYALFPRLGRKVNPIFITQVKDRDGKILEENKPQPMTVGNTTQMASAPQVMPSTQPIAVASGKPKVSFPELPSSENPDQVMDPRVAYVMTHLMKEVVAYGTGHEAKALGKPAAGKTGTTNDYIDAWFMGFTPNVVTGTWVGYDNHRAIGPNETGAKAALPIWLSFMKEAVKNHTDADFNVPPGVVFASIDPVSGKLAPPNSSKAIREAFIEGTEPTQMSTPNGGSDTQSEFFKEDIE